MELVSGIIIALLSTLFTIYIQKAIGKRKQNNIKKTYSTKVNKDANKKLSEHSNEFQKEVVKVGDNIYVAVGYGLANCIMIEGNNGVIIIDTMENCETAKEVKDEFTKISSKPIVGIVLTHFHADHAHGTKEFLGDTESGEIEIFAHETFPQYFNQVMDVRGPITYARAVRQFGTEIPEDAHENNGIGLNLKLDGSMTISYIQPTTTFSDSLEINLAGIKLKLLHAPGETNDQIIVWYPEKKILFPADNIYKAFPNLYAIRGCMHRDTLQWVAALDKMIDLCPEILVPQHTQVLYGKDTVLDTLTAYRDAIQFVHDQTVRYMNKGLSAREISEKVRLPPHLENHPYLVEYYGTVEWSVRAVYHGYIGWFSGRPADLHPLPRSEEARLHVDLAGGPEEMLSKAQKALTDGNHKWSLQLTDYLIDCGMGSAGVRDVRGKCLRWLANQEVSGPGRNWYLTEDLIQEGLEIKINQKQRANRIMRGDIRSLFKMLTCMVDAEATFSVTSTALFEFSDTEEKLVMVVRKGVAFLPTNISSYEPDITVFTTEKVWKEVMSKQRSPLSASVTGDIKVTPGIKALGTFMGYFDTGS